MFKIKQGNRLPYMEFTLVDAQAVDDDNPDGTPVNLAGCTVVLKCRPERRGEALRTISTIEIDDAGAGVGHVEWGEDDTDEAGVWVGEFLVTDEDGLERTFPSDETRVTWQVYPALSSS